MVRIPVLFPYQLLKILQGTPKIPPKCHKILARSPQDLLKTTPRYPKILWEAYYNELPFLGVPENPTDSDKRDCPQSIPCMSCRKIHVSDYRGKGNDGSWRCIEVLLSILTLVKLLPGTLRPTSL